MRSRIAPLTAAGLLALAAVNAWLLTIVTVDGETQENEPVPGVAPYLNVTEARKQLLNLVERLHGSDRVVITKHGRPRAVLVDSERYALLEDLAWVLQEPGRRAASTLRLTSSSRIRRPRRRSHALALPR